jgi:magnesium transporter
MRPNRAAAIIEELSSADRADLLGELEDSEADAILDQMTEAEASEARLLLQYPADTAGGVMITEFLSYPDRVTVEEVVEDLWAYGEHYSDYDIQYAYVTHDDGVLSGVLRLRDLLLAQRHIPVREIIIEDPIRVPVDAGIEELNRLFDAHPFFGVPAVDSHGRLVGVVRRAAVEEALGEQATDASLAVSGIIGEDELRTMPVLHRSRRRLSWLSINIILNIIAASVIAFYQDTLSAVIALAVFLPIIADMSGCSGNQAVAGSIPELALGLLEPYEYARVMLKEGAVGMIDGLMLGVLLGVSGRRQRTWSERPATRWSLSRANGGRAQ